MCSTEIRIFICMVVVVCGIGLLVISNFMPEDNDTIVVKTASTVNEERILTLPLFYQNQSINTTQSINNTPLINVAESITNTDPIDITESINIADPKDSTASENEDNLSSRTNQLITSDVAELDDRMLPPPFVKQLYGIELYNLSDADPTDLNIYCANTRTDPAFKICMNDTDIDNISDALIAGRLWDSELRTRLLQSVLKQNTHFTVLDIGANLGYVSLLAASLGHYVVAVEPWEQHLRQFAKSINLNGFQDKIIVFRNAVSNDRRIGHVGVHNDNERNQGATRLLSDDETEVSADIIPTSTILLDDLAYFISTKYVILKLDIDGHECRAMEHVGWLFDTFQVLLIFTEWGMMTSRKNEQGIACPPESIQQTTRMLLSRGFVPYTFPNQQLDPRESDNWPHMDVYWWLEQ